MSKEGGVKITSALRARLRVGGKAAHGGEDFMMDVCARDGRLGLLTIIGKMITRAALPMRENSPPASLFATALPSPHRLQEAVIIHPPLVGLVAEYGDPAGAKKG